MFGERDVLLPIVRPDCTSVKSWKAAHSITLILTLTLTLTPRPRPYPHLTLTLMHMHKHKYATQTSSRYTSSCHHMRADNAHWYGMHKSQRLQLSQESLRRIAAIHLWLFVDSVGVRLCDSYNYGCAVAVHTARS